MRFVNKGGTQDRFIGKLYLIIVLLVYFATQTVFLKADRTEYKATISKFSPVLVNSVTGVVVAEEEVTTTTTSTTTTTIEEVTTTTVVVRTTVPRTTVVTSREAFSGSDGPPRNITSLVGCIAYYESTWGDIDSNVFQFIPSTWRAYGGTGSPENAPYWRQEEIFWLAWNDAGPHHWAAQKGRCF